MKASRVLMIRPLRFGFNEQTAGSNSFQRSAGTADRETIRQQAVQEFDALAEKLKAAGIEVIIFEDTLSPHTPDAVFPNNWISFHENNGLVLYPMLAENRRLERRPDIIKHFTNSSTRKIDLSARELNNEILEGTGSIVFDYANRIAYANSSPRTNKQLLTELCKKLNYKALTFKALDLAGADIYHTNVLMCIGDSFAVLCKESIRDPEELKMVMDSLNETGHAIIEISYAQMNSFAGNMYQLFNHEGRSFIAMSEQAFRSLDKEQVRALEKHGTLLYSPLYTIEKHGGGSARCMIADVRF